MFGLKAHTDRIAKQQNPGYRWLVLILILFCEFLAHTWVRTESTQTILSISTAQAGIAAKLSYRNELAVERDRLKSDDRITQIARTHLDLSTDVLNQTIYFSGDAR